MITCGAHNCSSNESTKIDGKDIKFFPFPNDDAQKEQWLKNSQIDNAEVSDQTLYLCELHFEKMSFTDDKELKENTVPTVFDTAEESQRKRKAEVPLQIESSKSPPIKQQKLDEDPHSLVTPPQSPLPQPPDAVGEITSKNKTDVPEEQNVSLNGSAIVRSELIHDIEINKKIYRLTIQIDKIYGKPCPKSKKLGILMEANNIKCEPPVFINTYDQKGRFMLKGRKVCEKGECKLRRSVYGSKPAFQCEHCDRFYVMKRNDKGGEKNNSCFICHKFFSSSQSLYRHIKTHFVCDMCQTECNSQVSYDKHARLHVSTDPLYPYKCHQCAEIFELKEDVRQHYLIIHPAVKPQNTVSQQTGSSMQSQSAQQPKEYRCVSCNITFRNEQAYRNHTSSHKKKEDLRCNIGDANSIFPVPNPLTGSQIGILRAVKFSCRVCSMEFDNVGEVDKHTRTHLEDVEDKCNICKKLFKSSVQLNEHLKHHLSRAHPCPLCSKAFINRTTLKIHLKTHSEV